MSVSAKKRIWGWMAFDWAQQPYYTLGLTFIFGPYFAAVAADWFHRERFDHTRSRRAIALVPRLCHCGCDHRNFGAIYGRMGRPPADAKSLGSLSFQ